MYIFTFILLFFATSAQAAVLETNEWGNRTQTGWEYSTPAGNPTNDLAPAGGCGASPSGGGTIRGNFIGPQTTTSSLGGGTSRYIVPSSTIITTLFYGHWICFSNPFTFHPIGTKIHFNTNRTASGGNVNPTGRDNYVINAQPNGNGVNVTTQINWDNCTYPNPNFAVQICTKNWYENKGHIQLVPGRWYWIETQATMNTIGNGFSSSHDGILRAWVDDVLLIEYTDVVFRTTAGNDWGDLSNSPILGGGGMVIPQTQYMFYDHNVISTTQIGRPGGGGGTIDTTPPTLPTNLTAASPNGNSVLLNWSNGLPNSDVSKVNIQRCTGAACTVMTALASPAASGAVGTFTDATVSPNNTYGYKINNQDSSGNASAFTAIVYVTTSTSFRTTLFSDDFTRANNADIGSVYDAGYTARNAFKLSSNSISPTVNAQASVETYNVAFPNDQWWQFSVPVWNQPSDNAMCRLRWAAPPTESGYEFAIITNQSVAEIRTYTAGAVTVLQTTSLPFALTSGDFIRCEAQGTALKMYFIRNGVETLAAAISDGTWAAGRPGMRAITTVILDFQLDNISGGGFTGTQQSAISLNSVSSSAATNTNATLSWQHTIASGSNIGLGVCLSARGLSAASNTANSVTVAGLAATKIIENIRDSGTDKFGSAWFWFPNPPIGAVTIVGTWSNVANSYNVGSAVAFNGIDPNAVIDASGGSTGNSTSISGSITSTVANATITDCILASPAPPITPTGGQTTLVSRNTTIGNDPILISSKTLVVAGATTMSGSTGTSGDWSTSILSIKPASVSVTDLPKITNLVADSGGVTISVGPVNPTTYRLTFGVNSSPVTTSLIRDFSIVGTRVNFAWPAGSQWLQVFARNASGVENITIDQYGAADLRPVVVQIDVTPSTFTSTFPTITLPFGTTSANFGGETDKGVNCLWDTVNQSYDLMPVANLMNSFGLTQSFLKTGLTNNSSITLYMGCRFNANGVDLTSTNQAVTIAVAAAAGDVTPPAIPANLIGQEIVPGVAELNWNSVADGDLLGYQVYNSFGACATYTPMGTRVAAGTTKFTSVSLIGGQTYCFKLRSVDTSLNESGDSNITTVSMHGSVDTTPPTAPSALVVTGLWTKSVLVDFIAGTDFQSVVTTNFEQCVTPCTVFLGAKMSSSNLNLIERLVPGTDYCIRGFSIDDSGNRSLGVSETVCFTTPTTGLEGPRQEVLFGSTRPTTARQPVPARQLRP